MKIGDRHYIERQPGKSLFKWEPHDTWIGVYWEWWTSKLHHVTGKHSFMLTLYVCPLPTLLFRFRLGGEKFW